MISYDTTIFIDRPQQDVWPYVSDPVNYSKWHWQRPDQPADLLDRQDHRDAPTRSCPMNTSEVRILHFPDVAEKEQ